MLSSPVARGVGAFGIRIDKPPPTSAWMESGLISHSTIEFTNSMSDRELSPSLPTFRNLITSPAVSANLAVAVLGMRPCSEGGYEYLHVTDNVHIGDVTPLYTRSLGDVNTVFCEVGLEPVLVVQPVDGLGKIFPVHENLGRSFEA